MSGAASTHIHGPIAAALSAQLLGSVGFGLLAPVLPFFVQVLGAPVSGVTQIVATYALAGVVCSPLLGRCSDRFGRKIVIVCALACTAGSYAGLLAAQSIVAVVLCRAVAGGASGQFGVLTALVIDSASPGERDRSIGWLGAMGAIGVTLGPLLGALLAQFPLPGVDPLHGVILCALCLALITLAFVARSVPSAREPGRADRADRPTDLAALRPVAALLGLNFGVFLAFGVMFSTTAIYVERRFGWGPSEAGYAIGAMTAAVAGARLSLAHRLLRRFGAGRLLPVATLAFAASLSGSVLTGDWRLFLASYCVAAACYAIAALCITVTLADAAPPAQRGALLGWSNSAGSIAIAISATLSGTLFDAISPAAPFHAGGAAMTLVLAAWLFRQASRSRTNSSARSFTDPRRSYARRR